MEDVDETVAFVEQIVRFGKILNVNGPCDDVRFRDPLKYPIHAAGSASLNDLTCFVSSFKKMSPSSYHRAHTCHTLVDLTKCMISTKNFSFAISFGQGRVEHFLLQPSKC